MAEKRFVILDNVAVLTDERNVRVVVEFFSQQRFMVQGGLDFDHL